MDNIKFKIIPFLTVFKTIGTTQFKSFNKTKTVLQWYNFDCKERKAFFSCVFEKREPFVFINSIRLRKPTSFRWWVVDKD